MKYHPPCDQCDLVWSDQQQALVVTCPRPHDDHVPE